MVLNVCLLIITPCQAYAQYICIGNYSTLPSIRRFDHVSREYTDQKNSAEIDHQLKFYLQYFCVWDPEIMHAYIHVLCMYIHTYAYMYTYTYICHGEYSYVVYVCLHTYICVYVSAKLHRFLSPSMHPSLHLHM